MNYQWTALSVLSGILFSEIMIGVLTFLSISQPTRRFKRITVDLGLKYVSFFLSIGAVLCVLTGFFIVTQGSLQCSFVPFLHATLYFCFRCGMHIFLYRKERLVKFGANATRKKIEKIFYAFFAILCIATIYPIALRAVTGEETCVRDSVPLTIIAFLVVDNANCLLTLYLFVGPLMSGIKFDQKNAKGGNKVLNSKETITRNIVCFLVTAASMSVALMACLRLYSGPEQWISVTYVILCVDMFVCHCVLLFSTWPGWRKFYRVDTIASPKSRSNSYVLTKNPSLRPIPYPKPTLGSSSIGVSSTSAM